MQHIVTSNVASNLKEAHDVVTLVKAVRINTAPEDFPGPFVSYSASSVIGRDLKLIAT